MSRRRDPTPKHNAHLHVPLNLWNTFAAYAAIDKKPVKALIVEAMQVFAAQRQKGTPK